MNAPDTITTCAYRECDCELDDQMIAKGGRSYCSPGCVAGKGCDHSDCNCSETSDDFDAQSEARRDAERRYRKSVRATEDGSTDAERAEEARALKKREKARAHNAERAAKSERKA